MNRGSIIGVIAVLLLVLGACGEEAPVDNERGSSSNSSQSLPEPGATPAGIDAALDQATALVDATVAEAASGLKASPQPTNGRLSGCETQEGPELTYTSYGVSLELTDDGAGLMRAVKTFWTNQGYDVEQDAPDAIYLSFDGFNFELFVNTQSRRAFLGGSTPCYPPT